MKKDTNSIKLKIRQIYYDYANEPDFVIKEKYGDKSEKSVSDVIVDLFEKEVIGIIKEKEGKVYICISVVDCLGHVSRNVEIYAFDQLLELIKNTVINGK